MKTIRCIISVITLLTCFSCKTLEMCGDVHKPSELPWLDSIAKTEVNINGQKLESIDKIVYSTGGSATRYIGFYVQYETKCCDIPSEFIYNCEGEIITYYGGYTGCYGECYMKIHSKKNIFTAK